MQLGCFPGASVGVLVPSIWANPIGGLGAGAGRIGESLRGAMREGPNT